MKMRNNIIFLLGNGFDLSNDLKTSYKDFILFYLRNSIIQAVENDSKIYNDDCFKIKIKWIVNVEHSKYYLEYFEEKLNEGKIADILFDIDDEKKLRGDGRLTIYTKSLFIKEILLHCFESDWNGIEHTIYKTIKSAFLSVQHDLDRISINPIDSSNYYFANERINDLNVTVDCLKKKLINYLNTLEYGNMLKPESVFNKNLIWGFNYSERIASYTQDLTRNVLFLNFNYTEYYLNIIKDLESIVNDTYTKFDSISIHGSLESSIDDIVFGIGDEQNDFYHKIESFFGDSWLKNMKSFHYFRQENYQRLLGFISKGNYEVYVLGHSCSITDRTLLNMIFENESCMKINIFHHKGIDSYLKIAYNISRNFSDKVKLRKVLQPFNPLLKM